MLLIRYLAILLFLAFLTYVLAIVIPFLRRRRDTVGDPLAFQWHFFVPCRDEEAVIGETIHRLTSDFPDAAVWVIDDDSTDSTSAIVSAAAEENPRVRLVQRRLPHARTGKGDALNAAYRQMLAALPPGTDHSQVIVCVVDADGELDRRARDYVSGPGCFADPKVGAAQLTVVMRNRGMEHPLGEGPGALRQAFARYLVRMQDIEFRTVIAAMQSLRSRTKSVGLGGNGQFTRLSALDLIAKSAGDPWHGALLEDYELGVHVLLEGYEIRYMHDTYVTQEAVPHFRRLVTQRTRWAQGNIQCLKYFPQLVRSPKIGNQALVESAYYLALPFVQLIGLVVFSTLAVLGAWAVLTGQIDTYLYTHFWWIPVALTLFSIAPFAMWAPIYRWKCEPGTPWWKVPLYAVGIWLYVYYTYLCIPRAFYRVIRRKNGWLKTKRNAEALVRGPIAIEH